MHRSRMAFALGLVGPLLVLGGCSGSDPQPKIAPPASTAPTSASPTPSPQSLSPVATVRAWVEAQNHAMATGDTSELRTLSATSCQACDDFIETIEGVYGDGGRFMTDGWSVKGAKARSQKARPVVIDTAVSFAGGKTILKRGGHPVSYEPENHIMVFKVVGQGDAWAVSFIGFIS